MQDLRARATLLGFKRTTRTGLFMLNGLVMRCVSSSLSLRPRKAADVGVTHLLLEDDESISICIAGQCRSKRLLFCTSDTLALRLRGESRAP